MKLSFNFFSEKFIFKGDLTIWIIFILFCITSIIEVYSASSNISYATGAYWKPAMEHMGHIFIGFILVLILQKMPCRYFKLFPILMLPLSTGALIMTLFTDKVNNASRWLTLFGITFQPSEIAKLTLIVYIALMLSNMQIENGMRKEAFKWILWPTIFFCALIVPENLSTAVITFTLACIMMYIGRIPWKQLSFLFSTLTIMVVGLFCLVNFTPDNTIKEIGKLPGCHRVPTWVARIKKHTATPIEAKEYKITDQNTQVTHAQIAVATSSLWGKGPGNSVERDFLPQPFSDFIYAIIIEETGLLGGGFVIFLYLALLYRVSRIASQCERSFPAFLIIGLATGMVLQAMLNMAVAVGWAPVTGQTLPLISKGGTSIIINCIYIGMILSVSVSAKKISQDKT